MNQELRNIQEELTKAFIAYQHRVDNPSPSKDDTEENIFLKYRSDYIFHNKVDSIVCGVMCIISKHLKDK